MNEKIDQILRQLDEEKKIKQESEENSLSGKISSNIMGFATFNGAVLYVIQLVLQFIFFPIRGILYWVLATVIWRHYKPIWNRFAYKNVDGVKKFSKVRGFMTIVSSMAVIFVFYMSIGLIYDTTLYMFTARVHETVYLSNAQEIGPNENIFSVQGCEVEAKGENFSCSADNSLYFRIDANAFSEIWSVLHNHSFFFPDYVAAPIAPGWQRCVITSYGFRMKIFLRGFDIYPYLLSAKCEQI